MVGDVKQSIYKFRLAMPFIFTEKKDSFAHYEEGSDNINQKIILSKNFRSRKGVCDYVNFVCSHIMSKKVGGIDYNEEEMLNSNDDFKASDVPSAQIKYVSIPDGENTIEYEARQIANYILNKVASKEQYGIPTVANNKLNLFENKEVVILLNFLRVIDNPTQDISLLATLMSVFYFP